MDEVTKKYRGGRPTKFDKAAIEVLLEGINMGLTLKAACKASSFSYSTLASWMTRGRVAKKNGIENKFTSLLEQVRAATRTVMLEHRNQVLNNLKSRDLRYWKTSPRK